MGLPGQPGEPPRLGHARLGRVCTRRVPLGARHVAQLPRVAFGQPKVGTRLQLQRGEGGAAQQRVLEHAGGGAEFAALAHQFGTEQGHPHCVARAGRGEGCLGDLQGAAIVAVGAQRAGHGKALDGRQAGVAVAHEARRQGTHQRH